MALTQEHIPENVDIGDQPQPPIKFSTLTSAETDLREKMLAFINEEEHSDLPIKQYRTVLPGCPGRVDHLIIESRTELGALIAFADWKIDHSNLDSDWTYYEEIYSQIFDKDQFEDLIKHLVLLLIKEPNRIDPNTEDAYMIEITESTIISPFNQTLVKGSR